MAKTRSFYDVLTEAIAYFTSHGFMSQERLEFWVRELGLAAERSLPSATKIQAMLRMSLGGIYRRLVEKRGILKKHPGLPLFTLERVQPRLRAELDRRIMASANLIKLNRAASKEKTLQRFAGWATSIPPGGSEAVDKSKVNNDVRKALKQLSFEDRRVAIDQGHKFTSNLNDILATDGGAIAARWHSHWREGIPEGSDPDAKGTYHYRPEHKVRDELVYLIKDSWAHKNGLVKPGKNGYTDDITKPGEEIFCRCFYEYIYSLRSMPDDMLTQKGRDELKRVKINI